MMFLCGLDNDDQPVAIMIANCKAITLLRYDDGDALYVEWGDKQTGRTVQAIGATVCDATMLIPVLDLFSQKASKKP
jgi:hypothetical protein